MRKTEEPMRKTLALALTALVGCAANRPATPPADACTGVESPLTHPVSAVVPLVESFATESKKIALTRLVGAEVVLPAREGVTVQLLERGARCHTAHAVASSDDPLSVPNAEIRVSALEGSFALRITSTDPDVARDILARAQRLPR